MASLPFANDGSFLEQFRLIQAKKEAAAGTNAPSEQQQLADVPSCTDAAAGTSDVDTASCAAPVPPNLPAFNASLVPEVHTSTSAAFEACKAFAGSRPGFAFKLGDEGHGYYPDYKEPGLCDLKKTKSKVPDPSKPVILRSNNPIVNLRGRARPVVPGPEAKKLKKDNNGGAANKPHYLKELERYKQQACGSDGPCDRPLVK